MKRKSTRISLSVYTEDMEAFDQIADERRLSRSSLLRESMMKTINECKKANCE